jgi:hypothetical protein
VDAAELLAAIAMLRRSWIVMVLCLLMGVLGGFAVGYQGEKCSATAVGLINIPPSQHAQLALAGARLSSNLTLTHVRLINPAVVLSRAAAIRISAR